MSYLHLVQVPDLERNFKAGVRRGDPVAGTWGAMAAAMMHDSSVHDQDQDVNLQYLQYVGMAQEIVFLK